MRVVSSMLCACLLALSAASAPAQAPPAKAKAKPAAPAPAQAKPAAAPKLTPPQTVIATVNGEPITAIELREYLDKFPFELEPGKEKETLAEFFKVGANMIANTKLLNRYVINQKAVATEKEIDAEVERLKAELKADGQDLFNVLATNDIPIAKLREQIASGIRWANFTKQMATDELLKKYVDDNKDLFYGSTVKASHILLKLPPDATPEVKEQAKQKLLGIKKQIEGGQISFADAANKFSEDDGNVATKSGGDLGYFRRRNQYIEKFAAAAFGLKKGSISDPVETEYGLHLIQVNDRKEGKPIDFEQNKVAIFNQYVTDLQQQIVDSERKTAKIDIKPVPPDFFPPITPQNVAPAPAAAPATKPAAAQPKPAAPK
ncbi:peptidylprolyl isomerase [Isosphaeraceae bacterium EP7]